ncbi:MAG: zeta toxin family protein [Rickettsiales bacterium]|nr:zeta toxin family protein [Rickettsiales bacterium]
MKLLRDKVINFIYNIFANNCKNDVKSKFESDYFNKVVEEQIKLLTKDKTPLQKPFLIRTAGQCGSGKTTQLLPAIEKNLPTNNYVHLAVRSFAKIHPYYSYLISEYGDGLIREKTNGFALLCLFKITEILIKNKYNIFLEMTILDPIFEEYINKIAKNHNYAILFNIMTIPIEISNYLVNQRAKESIIEKNRIVPCETLNYFYNILPLGIANIINNYAIFDKNDYFIIWNINQPKPILITNKFDKEILEIFNKNRIYKKDCEIKLKSSQEKLAEKMIFYEKFLLSWKF